MLKSVRRFSNLLGVDPFWIRLLFVLIVILLIVQGMCPWRPKWKSKKTKDKDGNEITVYYHLDI